MKVAIKWMSGFYCQGDPECREEKVTLIGEKPVEECQVQNNLLVFVRTEYCLQIAAPCVSVGATQSVQKGDSVSSLPGA